MERIEPPVDRVEASGPAGPSLGALVAELDSAADPSAALARVRAWLDAAPPTEASARELLALIDARAFDAVADADGRPLRLRALQALLRLGYPWALYITPGDLEWLREQQRPFWRRRASVLAAAAVGGGLLGWGASQAWPYVLAWWSARSP